MSKNEKKIKRLMHYEDTIAGEEIALDMYNNLRFGSNMDVEIDDTLVGYGLTGVLESMASERYEREKIMLDEFRGELDEQCREIESLGRPTDMKVRSWIDRHPEYVKRRKRLEEYKRRCQILKHFNKAFSMKADLLRTKAANLRKEYDELGFSPSPKLKKEKKNGG